MSKQNKITYSAWQHLLGTFNITKAPEGYMCATEISKETGQSRSNVNRLLRELHNAGKIDRVIVKVGRTNTPYYKEIKGSKARNLR